jgi:hypothetical protein
MPSHCAIRELKKSEKQQNAMLPADVSVGHPGSTPVTFSIIVYSMKEMAQHCWELAVDIAL